MLLPNSVQLVWRTGIQTGLLIAYYIGGGINSPNMGTHVAYLFDF